MTTAEQVPAAVEQQHDPVAGLQQLRRHLQRVQAEAERLTDTDRPVRKAMTETIGATGTAMHELYYDQIHPAARALQRQCRLRLAQLRAAEAELCGAEAVPVHVPDPNATAAGTTDADGEDAVDESDEAAGEDDANAEQWASDTA